MPRAVGFCGRAGSGKSTAASLLMKHYGWFVRVSLADPIKDMLRAIGLSERALQGDMKEVPSELLAGRTPRYAMQTLGTEWGRERIGPDLWVGIWMRRARQVMETGLSVVVDDVRFDNEVQAIRSLGGIVIAVSGRNGVVHDHASERPVRGDAEVVNDGTEDDLAQRIISILKGGVA